MGYLCAGLVIGRLRLSSARVAAGLLTGGALLAATASAASWLALGPLGGRDQIQASAPASGMSPAEITDALVFGADGVTPTSTWWWLTSDAPHTSTPLDLLHTTGTAAADAFTGPGVLVPTSNADLFRWCLGRDLRVVQLMTLMTTGLYRRPRGAYLPSVLY